MSNESRLQLIAQAAKRVQSEQQNKQLKLAGANLAGLCRQAVQIADREYTSKKDVDSITELRFN